MTIDPTPSATTPSSVPEILRSLGLFSNIQLFLGASRDSEALARTLRSRGANILESLDDPRLKAVIVKPTNVSEAFRVLAGRDVVVLHKSWVKACLDQDRLILDDNSINWGGHRLFDPNDNEVHEELPETHPSNHKMPSLYLSLDQAAAKLAKERGARKAERTKARMESALAASMATPQPLSLHSDDSAKPSLIGQSSTSLTESKPARYSTNRQFQSVSVLSSKASSNTAPIPWPPPARPTSTPSFTSLRQPSLPPLFSDDTRREDGKGKGRDPAHRLPTKDPRDRARSTSIRPFTAQHMASLQTEGAPIRPYPRSIVVAKHAPPKIKPPPRRRDIFVPPDSGTVLRGYLEPWNADNDDFLLSPEDAKDTLKSRGVELVSIESATHLFIHLPSNTPPSSALHMSLLLHKGKRVIRAEWLLECLKAGEWVDDEPFHVDLSPHQHPMPATVAVREEPKPFPTAASPLVRQVEHLDVTPNVSAIRKTHPKFTKKRPNSLSRVPTQFSDASTRSNAISPDMPSSLSSLDAQTKGPPPPGRDVLQQFLARLGSS